MPLKHATETFLVFLLGLILVITGITMALLPPLYVSFVPWLIAFVLSLLYPLLLYPLLKARRADYSFRLLHFLPSLLLLVWFLLEFSPETSLLTRLHRMYLWGWALPVIAVGFILLAAFCIDVIRERRGRLTLLALLFIPFAAAAVASEQFGWNAQIASLIAHPRMFFASGTGSTLTAQQSSEDRLKMELTRMERRRERLESDVVSSLQVSPARGGALQPLPSPRVTSRSAPQARPELAQSSSSPTRLTKSGPELNALIVAFLAAYCGVIHLRAKRRYELAS